MKQIPECKPDNVTVIDFEHSLYRSTVWVTREASFFSIDSDGDTGIGSGIRLPIDEIIEDQDAEYINHHAGIVLLTIGQDDNPANQFAQFQRAASLGVRVSFSFLSPPANSVTRKRGLDKRQSTSDLRLAIIQNGDTFGTINSVFGRGITNIGACGAIHTLKPNVTITDFIGNATERNHIYSADAGEHVNFTAVSVAGFVQCNSA
jgi:hypothetical protein